MLIPITEALVYIGGTLRSRHELKPDEYTIGRDPDCDIPIQANLVSWQHARLTLNYDEWFIEDLDSANGTLVNDEPLSSRSQRVWPSQTIRIGKATIALRVLPPKDPDPGASLPPAVEVIREYFPTEILQKRHLIKSSVAEGGMGEILDATDQTTGRTVAMKVMLDQRDSSDVERFIVEARVTAQLEHPNIVPVHELGVNEQDKVFYTMKFVRGITLRKVLETLAERDTTFVAKYPLAALLTIFQKICDAVAFAHSRGVIHRDLKPENVMLGDFGEVLLMDWGLAKVPGLGRRFERAHGRVVQDVETASYRTMPGTVLGTPQYMAPEQARGEVDTLDHRADVYSLGAILFHILTLRHSVSGRIPAEVVDKVGRGEIEDLAGIEGKPLLHLPGGRIPDSLAAVVRKAMALDPDDRYPNVAGLQSDITAYQSGFATSAENASAWKQLTLLVRRHRIIATAVTVSLLLITVISALSFRSIIAARDEAREQFRRAEIEKADAKDARAVAVRESEEKSAALAEARKANAKETAALAKETAERERKDEALMRLRKTAPDLYALAREHAKNSQFADALAKLEAALDLDAENAEYHLLRGHQFQATEQLDQAAAAYRKVLELQPVPAIAASARLNLDLCESILRDSAPGKPLDDQGRGKLHEGILKQERLADLVEIGAKMGGTRAADLQKIKTVLSPLPKDPGFGKWEDRLGPLPNGAFWLNLSNLVVPELPSFAGLAITTLVLDGSRVRSFEALRGSRIDTLSANGTTIWDLTPLSGLPLTNLSLRGTAIATLAPLRGLRLQRLVISATRVTDLTPLAGMPLAELVAESMDIRDISILASLPLQRLSLRYCNALRDLTPLGACRTLESLLIPQQPPGTDLLFLRSLPNLVRMSDQPGADHAGIPRFHQVPAPSSVWDRRTLQTSERERLNKAYEKISAPLLAQYPPKETFTREGLIELEITDYPAADLSALRRLPIVALKAVGAAIADFSPLAETPLDELEIGGRVAGENPTLDFGSLRKVTTLRNLTIRNSSFADLRLLEGLPLQSLDLVGTAVSDLSPLVTMPLVDLDLRATKVTSIKPLLKIPTLRQVGLPDTVQDAALLKMVKGLTVFDNKKPAPPKLGKQRRR